LNDRPAAANQRLVFVSPASEDTWVAKQIAREIEASGAYTFLDDADVDIGGEFEEDIRSFLARADELLVLLTPWALERSYVWIEIGTAMFRGIPIIVVLHGLSPRQFQAHPKVPVGIKRRNVIGLNDIDRYFYQLKRRIGARP
jgi:hypothetical protein